MPWQHGPEVLSRGGWCRWLRAVGSVRLHAAQSVGGSAAFRPRGRVWPFIRCLSAATVRSMARPRGVPTAPTIPAVNSSRIGDTPL